MNWSLTALTNYVQAVAVDPHDTSILYAGDSEDALYRSPNGGAGWTPASQGLNATNVFDLLVGPQPSGTVYAATDGGVFTSADQGADWTWTDASQGLPTLNGYTNVYSLAIASSTSPDTVYAGTDRGVFVRTFMSYNLGFRDNGDTSALCVDSTTGAFQWTVAGGNTYAGTLNVYNGGTMFWSQPGASQYVYIYYDPNGHMAWGYLYDYANRAYSSLFDSNTLNDPPGCAIVVD